MTRTATWVANVAVPHEGDECLIWPFGRDGRGYGMMRMGKKMVHAHRHICTIVSGPPPTPKHEAAHSCGKGHMGCVNPHHLRWATHAENMADAISHGTTTRGRKSKQSRLTESDVHEIRALRGVETHVALAARFLVDRSMISLVQTGKRWAWLGGELRPDLSRIFVERPPSEKEDAA